MKVLAIFRELPAKETVNVKYNRSAIAWGLFFAPKDLTQRIVQACRLKLIKENTLYRFTLEGFKNTAYGLRQGDVWSVVAVNAKFDNDIEVVHFLKNCLNQELKLEALMTSPEDYTVDLKLAEIRSDLDDTKVALKDALEKACEREGDLVALAAKTEALQTEAVHFKKSAEELNSCWGFCNIL